MPKRMQYNFKCGRRDIVTPKHKNYKFLKSIELKKEWKECFNYTKRNFQD